MTANSLNNNDIHAGSGRIQFIDAMRGLIMFFVVSHHVSNLCFQVFASKSSIDDYVWEFLMPSFFFISGFVMYREGVRWDFGYIKKFFKKKIHLLLIVPLVFLLLNIYVFKKDIIECLFSVTKGGYWFTFVLFFYFSIYAIVKFCIRSELSDKVLVVIGLCMIVTCWPSIYDYLPVSESVLSKFCFSQWQYFIYFVIGTLVKKHYDEVQRLLDGKWLITICVLYYFLVNVFNNDMPLPSIIYYPLLSLSGIVILFAFFRSRQNFFSQQTFLGRALQFMGRRTLDIYWIHFFLIPYNLSMVTFFKDHNMPIIETTASYIVAIVITTATLLVSSILRMSPVLSFLLFGERQKEVK